MSVYSDRVLADGAVSYWRLGEAAGPTAVDSAGPNTGTYAGGITFSVAGATNDGDTAVTLNGTTGVVTLPSMTPGNLFTIEAFVRRGAAGANRTIAQIGKAALVFKANNTFALLHVGTGYYCTSTTTITDTDWHYVVGTYNGTTAKLYIDGVDVSGTTTVRTAAASVGAIGALDGTSEFWNGTVDEVAFYTAALTQAQVTTHYHTAIASASMPRDINTKLQVYFKTVLYAGTASTDLTTSLMRRIVALSGDVTARMKAIIVSAGGKN